VSTWGVPLGFGDANNGGVGLGEIGTGLSPEMMCGAVRHSQSLCMAQGSGLMGANKQAHASITLRARNLEAYPSEHTHTHQNRRCGGSSVLKMGVRQ
jgi:hypothetical protein